jgi:hypothetical protein
MQFYKRKIVILNIFKLKNLNKMLKLFKIYYKYISSKT